MKNYYFIKYNNFLKTLLAEVSKSFKLTSLTWLSVFEIIFWPLLNFFTVIFTFKVFNLKIFAQYGFNSTTGITTFLITGFLGMSSFTSMTIPAMSFERERIEGTLEVLFCTPASRLGIVFGRALGGIIQSLWTFVLFLGYFFYLNELHLSNITIFLFIEALIIVAAVIWGGFINTLFLSSRNNTFFYVLFNNPMEILSGVSIPISAFPKFISWSSTIFPLTYCLLVIRPLLLGKPFPTLQFSLYVLINALLIFIVTLLLKFTEHTERKNGSLTLF